MRFSYRYGDAAFALHGITSVDEKVHQRRLELVHINPREEALLSF